MLIFLLSSRPFIQLFVSFYGSLWANHEILSLESKCLRRICGFPFFATF